MSANDTSDTRRIAALLDRLDPPEGRCDASGCVHLTLSEMARLMRHDHVRRYDDPIQGITSRRDRSDQTRNEILLARHR